MGKNKLKIGDFSRLCKFTFGAKQQRRFELKQAKKKEKHRGIDE